MAFSILICNSQGSFMPAFSLPARLWGSYRSSVCEASPVPALGMPYTADSMFALTRELEYQRSLTASPEGWACASMALHGNSMASSATYWRADGRSPWGGDRCQGVESAMWISHRQFLSGPSRAYARNATYSYAYVQ